MDVVGFGGGAFAATSFTSIASSGSQEQVRPKNLQSSDGRATQAIDHVIANMDTHERVRRTALSDELELDEDLLVDLAIAR